MKQLKTSKSSASKKAVQALVNPVAAPIRKANQARLERLAGCWPAAEADRIASFIETQCETVHEAV